MIALVIGVLCGVFCCVCGVSTAIFGVGMARLIGVLSSFCGGITVGTGLAMTIDRWKDRKNAVPPKPGEMVYATVKRILGEEPVRLICTYEDKYTNKNHKFESTPIVNVSDISVGDTVKVRVGRVYGR